MIKAAGPDAELYLYDGQKQLDSHSWKADRVLAQTILSCIDDLLKRNSTSLKEIKALAVFSGPGSFTGLRIGHSVANSLAYALDLPIVATAGQDWQSSAIRRLQAGENDRMVLPHYGAAARTTAPRK